MALRNAQYNTIMRQYDRLQLDSQRQLTQHREEVYQLVPGYRELDDMTAKVSAAYARQALSQSPPSMDEVRRRLNEIELQKQTLLTKFGYPPSYMEPSYNCPDCKDTGYINDKKCHCFKQAVVDYVYTQSNIKERLLTENFDTFNLDYYSSAPDRNLGISPRDHMEMLLNVCRHFIDHFPKAENFLFYGNTGVGKTFLTNCIAKELLDRGETVIYLTAFQFVDILEANTFGDDSETESLKEMFDFLFDCDLLIVDDLGTEINNSFITSQLFLCINERILARKSTIISTNLSLENLENEYSERIFSRLISDYQIFPILGEDIRVKKAISS